MGLISMKVKKKKMQKKPIMIDKIEENDHFLFVDGNTMYCSNGTSLVVTKKDRDEAKKRKVTDDQIKILCYQYLSKKIDIDDYLNYLRTVEDH